VVLKGELDADRGLGARRVIGLVDGAGENEWILNAPSGAPVCLTAKARLAIDDAGSASLK
jgi:hypothetical protein